MLNIDFKTVTGGQRHKQTNADSSPGGKIDQGARAKEYPPVKMANRFTEFACMIANAIGVYGIRGRIDSDRHVVIIVAQGGIGDQTLFATEFAHDIVTGINAEGAGDAFQLLAVANIDTRRAHGDTSIAINTIPAQQRLLLLPFWTPLDLGSPRQSL